ncbi:sugar ABC transporter substrate-binding protein [Caldalkalibacillus salinus]|uniref:sugar ABC transporter substrate-binding protein n=1 Tax=Caldalkalibacillus salinus TaxID=2803787 RepID=UPI001922011D|nr:sugar ABC transporter substrate-binding protein [Caldalkalibacillus salinus]
MKKLLSWMSLCLLVWVLTACMGSEPSSQPGDGSSDGEVTVTFSYWGATFDKERMEAIRAEFEKVNEDINVELVNLPSEGYSQKQMTMMTAGNPYDVIQLAEQSYAFAARGTLEDLSPYIERDGVDLNDFYDVGIESYTHEGRVYGMPLRLGSMMMFYNKNLFDEHGLDYPDETWTWEDVIEAGEVITDHDEGVFGLSALGGWWASIAQFLHSNGGSILSEDRTAFNLDSPESLAAIELMNEIVNERDISPSASQIPEGVDLWTSGRIGMMVDGPWHILSSQANITDFDWDITVAPKGTQHASPTFSNAFHMSKASKNKEAAWEVIKFWTGPEAQAILAEEHGDTPSMIAVAESDTYLELGDNPPENFELMLESLNTAFAPEVTLMWGEINQVVQEGFSRVIDLNEPIEDVMPDVKSEVEDLLEEDKRLQEQFEED